MAVSRKCSTDMNTLTCGVARSAMNRSFVLRHRLPMLAGVPNSRQSGSNTVLLTQPGGGAFGNAAGGSMRPSRGRW